MPQLARLSLSQAGPLGVAQPDAASLPWCGALDDVPGCPSSTDRQGFADAVRKARIARLPDPAAGPVRDIADAIPQISSAALRLHKAAAAGIFSDPLIAAVAANVATVHHQSPAETQVALLKRLRDGLRIAKIDSAVVRVVGRAPAEVIEHITQMALHAIASSRPCALVFSDAVACYRQATNAWLQPACSAALNWALLLAARLADIAPGADGPATPLLRIVVTALPTLTIHDEIFSACLSAVPVGSCALVSDSGLGVTTEADDVIGATCAQAGLFPLGLEVASVDHKTPFAIDTVADALAELHTELALQMDTAGEDDVEDADADPAASNAGRVPVVVTVVPDAASAQVLRNAALARYVAEPMKLALWDGTADLVVGDAGPSLLDGPIGIADEVPLLVVAVADDVVTRAAAGNLAAFVAQATSDRDPYLAAVVNMGVADAGIGADSVAATALSVTAMRQVGLDIATALPRSRDAASGARFIVSPPLAAVSGGYDTVVDTVTVEASGRAWSAAKLAVDARREHVLYGADDECPSLGFSTILVPSQCCHREIAVTAEAAIAVCNGAHAVGRAALAAKSHKGRFGVDLEGLLLRDVAVPLPELLGASSLQRPGARRAATNESIGASTFASYIMRVVTLSEVVLEYGDIRAAVSGLPVVGISPVGSVVSSELGLWATRLFLAASATRAAATADDLLSVVASVAHDRRRLVTETAMQQPAAVAAFDASTTDSIIDALGSALSADVRRWAANANASPDDDDTKDASAPDSPGPAAALAAHTATLWASYPAVDIATTSTGGVGLVGAIARVLATANTVEDAGVCTRSQLAVAAPRSRRSFLPAAPKPAESCRGWAPVAPITLRSAGTVRVVSLDDEVADASHEKKRTVTIDEDAPTAAGPNGKTNAASGEVATHAFPPVDAASGHVCSVACDAAFGSALEGHLPSMIIPTDASAPLVVAKTLLRTFLVNVCTLAAGASAAHPIALPLLPDSVCTHPVWCSLMQPVATQGSNNNNKGVGRWIDGVGLKQPVSSARLFDPIGDSGKGLGTADVVAEMTAIEATGPKNKSHRSEGGGGANGSGNGGGGPKETAGFVGLLPSAQERELIDKAARNILKKGRAEAEALLLKQGKAAFGFVRPDHSFHPFYLHTIARLEAAAASAPVQ